MIHGNNDLYGGSIKENSLEEYTTDDGERVAFEPKWKSFIIFLHT